MIYADHPADAPIEQGDVIDECPLVLRSDRPSGAVPDDRVNATATDAKQVPADGGYDPQNGARPLKRCIQQRLRNALAGEVLAGRFEEGSTIKVDGTLDGFVFITQ